MILRDLTKLGYRLLPVHPEAAEVGGVPAFPSFAALPEPVGGVIVVVPPAQSQGVVKAAAAQGIRRVWLQQGAESAEAIAYCQAQGLSVVHGECVLMYLRPASSWVHGAHRWLREHVGHAPK
jgi:uncharacterized protein